MEATNGVCISPWHKGVLIPFWVLQLLFIVNALGVSGASITASGEAIYNNDYDYGENTSEDNGDYFAIATWSTTIAFCLVSKAFIVAEIILFSRRRLREVIYFAFQVTNMTLWTCLIIVQVVNCTQRFRFLTVYFWASFGINLVTWALFLGTLIYGSVIFHRFRVRNKPTRYNAEPIYIVNQPQQIIQVPAGLNPISPAYLAALNQLGALNHPNPQSLVNSGNYPSIHITYNYGPTQGAPAPQQGHILGDISQNQAPGNTNVPGQNANPGGNSAVPARRPVASNSTYISGISSAPDYEPPEVDYSRVPNRGGPPSYVSHM